MKLKTKIGLASAFVALCVAVAIGQSYSTFNPPVGGGGGTPVNLRNKPFPVNVMDYGAFADGSNHTCTARDIIDHGPNGSKTHWVGTIVRTVTDGVTTLGSRTITSATANFTRADLGQRISGAGLPPNSRISAVTNSTTAAINCAYFEATASGTGVRFNIGDYKQGDTWDYIALQEAIYAAFQNGTTTPNKNNRWLNRPLYIPAGRYRVNKTPTMYEVEGGNVYGDGRLSTMISSITAKIPAWECNGLWFTQFTGIQWSTGNGDKTPEIPLFDVDGNWDTKHTLGVQGNTWKDCHWDASFGMSPLFAMARHFTDSQGSENLFLNCHFNNPSDVAFNNYNYNALQNTFIGGNISQHITGIRVGAGSANVYSMGFQALKPDQIDKNGYDFKQVNASDAHSSMVHCRSESWKRSSVTNGVMFTMDGCNLDSGADASWQADHAYITLGRIVSGLNPPTGHGNGHLHRLLVLGTSGSTEPVWNDNDGDPALEDWQTSINSGSDQLVTANLDHVGVHGHIPGRGIMVVGAGVGGANLYTTALAYDRPTKTITLATTASTTVTNARTVCSPITLDGTPPTQCQWIQEEFVEDAWNTPTIATNCSFRWGQVRATNATWPAVIMHSNFCRADWMLAHNPYGSSDVSGVIAFPQMVTWDGKVVSENFLTLNGGYNSGVPAVPIAFPSRATTLYSVEGVITTPMARAVNLITPTEDSTVNATGGNGGDRCTFIITTSGTTSRTITFGTNFKATGVLTTGTVSGKVWTVEFTCKDGTTWIETSRTGPL